VLGLAVAACGGGHAPRPAAAHPAPIRTAAATAGRSATHFVTAPIVLSVLNDPTPPKDYILFVMMRLSRDLPTRRDRIDGLVNVNQQTDLPTIHRYKGTRHCYLQEIEVDGNLIPGPTVEVELYRLHPRTLLDTARARPRQIHGIRPSSERYRSAERELGCV
jgi:hypothetical protein